MPAHRVRFALAVSCAVGGPALLDLPQAVAQEARPVAIDRVAEADALRLQIATYALRRDYLGATAPDGEAWLILRGAVANRATDRSLELGAVERTFALDLGESGFAALHPLSRDSIDPFWGPQSVPPGGTRATEMVFIVPSPGPSFARLVAVLGARQVEVPIVGAPPPRPARMLGEQRNEFAALTVESLEFATDIASERAPDGMRFAVVKLRHANVAAPSHPYVIARYLVLVEDGVYLHRPDAATARISPFLARAQAVPPPLAATSRAVFLVPERTGHLELRYHTPAGPIAVALDAGSAPPLPPPASPPAKGEFLGATILGVRSGAVPAPTPDARYIELDLALALDARPEQAVTFSADRALSLLNLATGGSYAVAPASSRLARALRDVELWGGATARGSVAFLVPADARDADLLLEVRERDRSFSLSLPSPGVPSPAQAVVPPTPAPPPPAAPRGGAESTLDRAIDLAGGEAAFGSLELGVLRRRFDALPGDAKGSVTSVFAMVAAIDPNLATPRALQATVTGAAATADRLALAVRALAGDEINGVGLGRSAQALGVTPAELSARLDAEVRRSRPGLALAVDADGRFRLLPAAAAPAPPAVVAAPAPPPSAAPPSLVLPPPPPPPPPAPAAPVVAPLAAAPPAAEAISIPSPPAAAAPATSAPPAASPPAASVPPTRDDRSVRVAALLADARQLVDERKLTTPRGGAALDRYNEVLRLDPDNADARAGIRGIAQTYKNWGMEQVQRGETDRAMASFARLAAVDPNDKSVHAHRGLAYMRAGKWDEAARAFRDGLKADGEAQYLWRELGFAQFRLGRYRAAAENLARAAAWDPRDATVHRYAGLSHGALGDRQRAVAAFERGLQFSPGDANLLRELGAARLELGQPERAAEALVAARRASPDNAFVYLYLALAYERLNRADEARDAWARQRELLERASPPGASR